MPDVNYGFEMGMVTVETPLFGYPKQTQDTAAGTATAETPIGIIGPGTVGIALAAIQIHPSSALTADNTNNATITVFKRTSAAPGTPVALAVATTSITGANATGNWVAFTTFNMTLVAGAFVSPGDEITLSITKGGTGVQLNPLFVGGFMTAR
jgi:hypothetical protein